MGTQAIQDLTDRLGTLLRSAGRPGDVVDLTRLSGGASRETWAFDLVDGEERRSLILQRQRAGTSGSGPGMQVEAALLRAAATAGVPVPAVIVDDDGATMGGPSIVMDRLDGETIARKLLRDDEWATARSRLVGQAGAALARIHQLPLDELPTLREADQLAEMRALLDSFGRPLPAFELAIRQLEQARPASPGRTVVHGDFRLGNLMVDAEGLAGVLDWELAHLGDPVEDLGWYCVRAWRFGSALPAGGTGTREELLAAYADAGGGQIDPEALRWWELLGTLKWGLICVLQSDAHLHGLSRSVELAAIGRRVCENEWDVLGLLPGPDLDADAFEEPDGEDAPDLYGRPTAQELVEAVREWIEGDVREATQGRVQFHGRVASNALKIIERELALARAHVPRHAAGLASLGCRDDAELSARIRGGDLDDRLVEVRSIVARSVRMKLQVANPRWLEPDD
ncbi:MAG: phosphotransferase family protein [Actinomycetota bacterium]|nr:phosphotransferase family protein [Actinomycetota bacterium]